MGHLIGCAWWWIGTNAPAIQTFALVATAIAAFAVIRHNAIISRREATINMVESQLEDDGDSYQDFKNLIKDIELVGQTTAEYASETANNKGARDIMLKQLNRYELISLSIKKRVFDESFYKRWFFSQLTRDYEKLLPFIMETRKLYTNDAYYCEFEALAQRWDAKKHPVKHPPKRMILWWVITNQRGRARRALTARK